MRSKSLLLFAVSALSLCPVAAQTLTGEYVWWTYTYDSGGLTNPTFQPLAVDTHLVTIAGAPSVRLSFEGVQLGAGDHLEITSLQDSAVQILNAPELAKWRDTSAFFNGDTVRVRLVVAPGSSASYSIRDVVVGNPYWAPPESICGTTDDRTLSQDWRALRAVSNPSGTSGGCTIWLVGNGPCALSAGHCTGTFGVAEAEVPLSNASGQAQHPAPNRQWPITLQNFTNGGLGNDWSIATLAPNGAGELPHQLYGSFELDFAVPSAGTPIRITGYGSTAAPVSPTWNSVNKTHVGPFVDVIGTQLRYATDTTGGNSGSPIIDESTGKAIGIHTNAGCTTSGGANSGTSILNAGFQAAWQLACAATTNDFRLELTSTAGNLDAEIFAVPTGTVQGYTLASLTTNQAVGAGNLFGLQADAFTLSILAVPAAPGDFFHWTWPVPAGVFPDAAFVLPAGALASFLGLTVDVQVVALGPGFAWFEVTNVVREQL